MTELKKNGEITIPSCLKQLINKLPNLLSCYLTQRLEIPRHGFLLPIHCAVGFQPEADVGAFLRGRSPFAEARLESLCELMQTGCGVISSSDIIPTCAYRVGYTVTLTCFNYLGREHSICKPVIYRL